MSTHTQEWTSQASPWNAVEPEKVEIPDTPASLFDSTLEGVDETGPGDIRLTQVSTKAGHLVTSHTPIVVGTEVGPEAFHG